MSRKAFYTTRDLSELAIRGGRPVTQEYIRQLCKSGRIDAVQPARDWIIRKAEAVRWLTEWLNN